MFTNGGLSVRIIELFEISYLHTYDKPIGASPGRDYESKEDGKYRTYYIMRLREMLGNPPFLLLPTPTFNSLLPLIEMN